MVKESENVVVLFANISDSARLYERMGDKEATDLIKTCLARMQQVTHDHMGDVINTIRDKLNCIFWDAVSAVSAAKSMSEAIDTYVAEETDGQIPVNLHIGIHLGAVQIEDDKLFGDSINLVTRVTQVAKPREIVITEAVYNELDDTLKPSAQQSTTISVKGSVTPLKLYEFVWEDYDATLAIDRNMLSQLTKAKHTCLELKMQDQIYEITIQNPRLYLGRQSQNDIVVSVKSASRFHAFIELRDGQFVLSDNSSNGTFIYPDESKSYHVKQKEAQLENTGALCLGDDSGPEALQAIHYRVKDASA